MEGLSSRNETAFIIGDLRPWKALPPFQYLTRPPKWRREGHIRRMRRLTAYLRAYGPPTRVRVSLGAN
jgi:hypothetical protein